MMQMPAMFVVLGGANEACTDKSMCFIPREDVVYPCNTNNYNLLNKVGKIDEKDSFIFNS